MVNCYSLPEEITIQIFSKLELKSLVQVSAVSQTWRRIANSENLWKFFFAHALIYSLGCAVDSILSKEELSYKERLFKLMFFSQLKVKQPASSAVVSHLMMLHHFNFKNPKVVIEGIEQLSYVDSDKLGFFYLTGVECLRKKQLKSALKILYLMKNGEAKEIFTSDVLNYLVANQKFSVAIKLILNLNCLSPRANYYFFLLVLTLERKQKIKLLLNFLAEATHFIYFDAIVRYICLHSTLTKATSILSLCRLYSKALERYDINDICLYIDLGQIAFAEKIALLYKETMPVTVLSYFAKIQKAYRENKDSQSENRIKLMKKEIMNKLQSNKTEAPFVIRRIEHSS